MFVNWRRQGWTHLAGAPLALSLLSGGTSSLKQLSQKQFTHPAFKTPSDGHYTGTADETEDHSTRLLLFSDETYLVLCPVLPTFDPPERWQSRELVPCVQTPTLPTAPLNMVV